MKEILHNDYRLLEYLETLLKSDNDKIKEHSIWSLSNILGSGDEFFEIVFTSTSLLDTLMDLVNEDKLSVGLMRTACWAVSNICK